MMKTTMVPLLTIDLTMMVTKHLQFEILDWGLHWSLVTSGWPEARRELQQFPKRH
jgi:hypothetical protein